MRNRKHRHQLDAQESQLLDAAVAKIKVLLF